MQKTYTRSELFCVSALALAIMITSATHAQSVATVGNTSLGIDVRSMDQGGPDVLPQVAVEGDCNNNGVPDQYDLNGFPIYSISANAPITTLFPVVRSFHVPYGGTIVDVNLGIEICHGWFEDLVIGLEHGGTSVVLAQRECYGVAEYCPDTLQFVFDDESSSSFSFPQCSNSGTFQPNQPLSAFDGMTAGGEWKLIIFDQVSGKREGELHSWTLDIQTVQSPDCNTNLNPDECDVADHISEDCNANGVPDECDLANDSSQDCNANGTPDECDPDCNANGIPDDCNPDCNGDGTADDCEVDTRIPFDIPTIPGPILDFQTMSRTFNVPFGGSILDVDVGVTLIHSDLADLVVTLTHGGVSVTLVNTSCSGEENLSGTVFDDEATGPISCSFGNIGRFRPAVPLSAFDGMDMAGDWILLIRDVGFLDEGFLIDWSLDIERVPPGDCNSNEVPDDCEPDCNDNNVADECDITDGTSEDCNANGIPDECDIFDGTSEDCNANGVPDDCDVTEGASEDCNASGTPDECEIIDGTSEDCNANGFPDECDLVGLIGDYNILLNPPATFSTSTISSTLVPVGGSILDVNVRIGDLSASDVSDIRISLTHGGTEVELWDRSCGLFTTGADAQMSNMVLDDEAANLISSTCCLCAAVPVGCFACGSVSGSYRPISPLSAFDGLDAAGDWTLSVTSTGFVDIGGSLSAWSLSVRTVDPSVDCNLNGSIDECDIAAGTSQDCNANGTPDDCEPGCSANGVPDECNIADGTSQDCNANGTPDDCEPGCSANGVPDECNIADGTSQDCNANGIPDECEQECNGNSVPDECDITIGTSQDCNVNGIPDECEPDCNGNNIADDCDITAGTSQDCNVNRIPDACEPDCNDNGIPDDCEALLSSYEITIDPTVPGAALLLNGSPTSNVFHVPVGGSILDVKVGVSLSNRSLGAIITLTHGDTSVQVYSGSPFCGEGTMSGTVFDDEAAGTFPCVPSNAGVFRPSSPLAAFDGKDAAGDWTLTVRSTAGCGTFEPPNCITGSLGAWSLTIRTLDPSLDCNANGTTDECDHDLAGDWNDDTIINLADYSFLTDCLARPGAATGYAECSDLCRSAFDQDLDGDVDLRDAGAFIILLTP